MRFIIIAALIALGLISCLPIGGYLPFGVTPALADARNGTL